MWRSDCKLYSLKKFFGGDFLSMKGGRQHKKIILIIFKEEELCVLKGF
jgi:hypothetical protein